VTAEIGWRCGALNFECDHRHLVDDSLINRQPVQAVQQRLGVGSSWHLEHDPSCVVLHTLKFLDGAGRSAVQESVAVVDSQVNTCASQRFLVVPASYVTGGLSVVVARLCYHCGVLLECQSPVQDDAKHFHLLRYWQVDPSDIQRWDAW